MASLFSAQAVIAAREQLNKELEEKTALSDHSSHHLEPNSLHKTEKHHPTHYHDTVHEKCKHHGEDKESLLHKKFHERLDQVKSREEHEHQHGDSRNNGPKSYRKIMSEREEIEDEMKRYARILQACVKGQHKLTEREIHEQHAGLYKWMLFIEELFRNYESSMRTQTSLHVLEQQEKKSEKILQEPFGLLSSPKIQNRSREAHSGKLPHFPTKERMDTLQGRVSQLQKQLQLSLSNNHEAAKQVKDLTSFIEQSQEKARIRKEKVKKLESSTRTLLEQMQDFNNALLVDLNVPEKLRSYPNIVASNLTKIKQFRESLQKDK